MPDFRIRAATIDDVPLILHFIIELARYEKMEDRVVANEARVRETLFGAKRSAEVLIGEEDGRAAGFALFFENYSTFLARPGIYLEDLFVDPAFRGRGYGKALLARLAQIAMERECGRVEWAVLDWNKPAIDFYKAIGANSVDEWTIFRLHGPALISLASSYDVPSQEE